jgi:hypothetical protein
MAELGSLAWQIGAAVREVIGSGTPEQHEQARDRLAEARRDLYRILAGDEPKQK